MRALTASPTILAAVDGSANSGKALDWAVLEAADRGGSLLIAHVIYSPVLYAPFMGSVSFDADDEQRERGAAILDAARDRAYRLAPRVPTEILTAVGPPAEVLLAKASDVDLIVVGTRGLGLMGSTAFGSVSAHLAARCPVPLIVVPPDSPDRAPAADTAPTAPAEATSDDFRGHVVVGIDGSPHSDLALDFAVEEAARRGSRLVIVAAWHVPAAGGWPEAILFSPNLRDEVANEARGYLQDALKKARQRLPNTEGVLIEDHPAAALLAKSRDAALTVVGSRGRGGIQGFMLGSVSQNVLRHAERPVAVVHVPQT